MKKILIICVDYNSASDTTTFVNSVMDMNPLVEVVLVLNSGKDEFEERFFERKRLYTYNFDSNLGYMQGAHNGLQAYLENHALPDWIILSNTDISFPDKTFFDRLSKDSRQCSIIAPDILSSDGVHQNPFLKRRVTKEKLQFLTKINSYKTAAFCYNLLAKIKLKYKIKHYKPMPASSTIYAPHGSFIIIGSSYFIQGETLEHPAFLYGEELIIAERAARSGVSIIYDSSYKIEHAEHVATGKMTSAFRSKALKDSLDAVLKEHY